MVWLRWGDASQLLAQYNRLDSVASDCCSWSQLDSSQSDLVWRSCTARSTDSLGICLVSSSARACLQPSPIQKIRMLSFCAQNNDNLTRICFQFLSTIVLNTLTNFKKICTLRISASRSKKSLSKFIKKKFLSVPKKIKILPNSQYTSDFSGLSRTFTSFSVYYVR